MPHLRLPSKGHAAAEPADGWPRKSASQEGRSHIGASAHSSADLRFSRSGCSKSRPRDIIRFPTVLQPRCIQTGAFPYFIHLKSVLSGRKLAAKMAWLATATSGFSDTPLAALPPRCEALWEDDFAISFIGANQCLYMPISSGFTICGLRTFKPRATSAISRRSLPAFAAARAILRRSPTTSARCWPNLA